MNSAMNLLGATAYFQRDLSTELQQSGDTRHLIGFAKISQVALVAASPNPASFAVYNPCSNWRMRQQKIQHRRKYKGENFSLSHF